MTISMYRRQEIRKEYTLCDHEKIKQEVQDKISATQNLVSLQAKDNKIPKETVL